MFGFVPMSYFYPETKSEDMGSALVGTNFPPILMKISFHIKKSDLLLPNIYKALPF